MACVDTIRIFPKHKGCATSDSRWNDREKYPWSQPHHCLYQTCLTARIELIAAWGWSSKVAFQAISGQEPNSWHSAFEDGEPGSARTYYFTDSTSRPLRTYKPSLCPYHVLKKYRSPRTKD
ncbi:hypothetical protein CaCOL14_011206 [Colletotrichum acutatum]